MDWYVFDKSTGRYLVIDEAENVWHEYLTIDELIVHVLNDSFSTDIDQE